MMHDLYGGGMYGFYLFQLLIFISIFVIIWWLLKDGLQKVSQSNKNNKTPLAILKERLAKGEITIKEFEKLKKEI